MLAEIAERPSLSTRLKTETAAEHERMHGLMERGQPFDTRENYARFVAAQYCFQRDIAQLVKDPRVQAVVPDAELRSRLQLALDDLADLGHPVPPVSPPAPTTTVAQALGWLYVSEGSTLGAAFLLKEAQARLGLSATFGARSLAAHPQGRALFWRQFVASLDGEAVATDEQDEVVAGAMAAYARFGDLLQQHFALA